MLSCLCEYQDQLTSKPHSSALLRFSVASSLCNIVERTTIYIGCLRETSQIVWYYGGNPPVTLTIFSLMTCRLNFEHVVGSTFYHSRVTHLSELASLMSENDKRPHVTLTECTSLLGIVPE